jgi:hypothetical protein
MGLSSDVSDALGTLEGAPGKVAEIFTGPYTPSVAVTWVVAVVLGIYALNFLLPGSATKNLNWNHLKTSLYSASNSALTLLPALSALVSPDSNPVMYIATGFAAYFIGLGIQCIPNPTCRTNQGGVGCSNVEKGWYFTGEGLQTAGVSSLVGAALIYLQNEVASSA